ncbi:MAG: hypothetical protein EBX68_04915 [Betaproteobacteria bacterium]|nr:hypothetical protein [Betaproteobacteria bacterium]
MKRRAAHTKSPAALAAVVEAPIKKTVPMPIGASLAVADTPAMGSTRWCTYCLGPKDAIGGMWMILHGGATQRWLCLTCAAKHRPYSASAAAKRAL